MSESPRAWTGVISRVKHQTKLGLRRLGMFPADPSTKPAGGYIDARQTVEAASAAGQSICQYVENLWDCVGVTERIVDQIDQRGVFRRANLNVLEIGAGTGRFMEINLARHDIARYESYERAADWAEYLSQIYRIISQPCDGSRLTATDNESVDVVVAYGVFVYLPLLVAARYFVDVARVLRPGGWFVFDAYTPKCFPDDVLDQWIMSDHDYPVVLPSEMIAHQLERRGLQFVDAFDNPYGIGQTEYQLFRKQ